MVAPGGALVVSVLAGKMFATEKTFGHVRHPELGWLRGAVEQSGLVVTDAFRWGYPTYLALKYAVTRWPEMSMREFGQGSYGPFKRSSQRRALLGELPQPDGLTEGLPDLPPGDAPGRGHRRRMTRQAPSGAGRARRC